MIKTFSQRNRERCESPRGFNHQLHSWSIPDWMVAVGGEIGEAANVIKKLNRVRDGIPGNVETAAELHAMLADEIADAAIYLDLLAQAAEFPTPERIREKTLAESRRHVPPGEPSLSDWMFYTFLEFGRLADLGTPAQLTRLWACLDTMATVAGFDLPQIMEAKFQKTNAKIGYVE